MSSAVRRSDKPRPCSARMVPVSSASTRIASACAASSRRRSMASRLSETTRRTRNPMTASVGTRVPMTSSSRWARSENVGAGRATETAIGGSKLSRGWAVDTQPHGSRRFGRRRRPATHLLTILRRLSLGLLLIAAASTILLLADREHRSGGPGRVRRIAILQHANTAVLDEGIRGTIDGLASRGFRDGETIAIEKFNAQGDMPTGVAIARQVTSGGYDLVITSSTPAMQAVANNNRDGKVRHLFTLVADPFESG